jgi:hypothetical protein
LHRKTRNKLYNFTDSSPLNTCDHFDCIQFQSNSTKR